MSPSIAAVTDLRIDAIVIGAGVIGASIALELQRGGRQVLVVDKGTAIGGGSTSSSASIIRFSYSTLGGVAASWEAKHLWERWAEHLGLSGAAEADGPLARFHKVGFLLIDEAEVDPRPMLENFERVGVPYEVLSGDDIAVRFPAIDPGRFGPPCHPPATEFFEPAKGAVTGIFQPDGGFVDDPQLATVNLMDAARRHGARVRLRSTVVEIMTEGSGADQQVVGIELDDGKQFFAPIIVNAAGPWSALVNELCDAPLDINIPTEPMRQDIASTIAPTNFGVDSGGTIVADLDFGTYFRPQPGGSFLVGGVEARCDPRVFVDNPDEASRLLDGNTAELLALRAARRLPELSIPRQPRGLVDFYDVSIDWTPIYDRSYVGGYYLAMGTSGNQFKNAPLVGQLLRGLIDYVEAGNDHDRNPFRFHCRHIDQWLDLGQFSRLREPGFTSDTVMG
ncbi:MAG: FAD-dependent oxidoreductase [Actinomycetota bacterium]|nr:FAD-dependent oxidoreductase [Actinomycetota bacterium]